MRRVSRRKRPQGFTLVEIVIAVGIFAFAIIGVVFLLGTGLKVSTEVQRDSALSSALMTASSLLKSSTPTPTVLYFDNTGSLTPSAANAFYQFAVTPASSHTTLPRVELFSIQVTAPHPSTNSVANFLVSRQK